MSLLIKKNKEQEKYMHTHTLQDLPLPLLFTSQIGYGYVMVRFQAHHISLKIAQGANVNTFLIKGGVGPFRTHDSTTILSCNTVYCAIVVNKNPSQHRILHLLLTCGADIPNEVMYSSFTPEIMLILLLSGKFAEYNIRKSLRSSRIRKNRDIEAVISGMCPFIEEGNLKFCRSPLENSFTRRTRFPFSLYTQ